MLRRCMQVAILFKIMTCQPTWYIRGTVLGLPERSEIVRLYYDVTYNKGLYMQFIHLGGNILRHFKMIGLLIYHYGTCAVGTFRCMHDRNGWKFMSNSIVTTGNHVGLVVGGFRHFSAGLWSYNVDEELYFCNARHFKWFGQFVSPNHEKQRKDSFVSRK